MELQRMLETTKLVKRLKTVNWGIFIAIVYIHTIKTILSLYNYFFKRRKIISNITSLLTSILPTMPLKSSISTQIFINFLVLSIMQTTCNTYILVGVEGSNSTGFPGNGTTSEANAKAKIAVAPWRDFQMENRYWVMVLSAVCGFWIVLAIFLATFCGPHQFTCHLCEEKIPRRMWQSGDHRAPCAQDHERFLYELPDATQKSAKCPTCGRTLKVWPEGLGPSAFKCHQGRNCETSILRKIRNKRLRQKPRKKVGNKTDDTKADSKDDEDDLENYAIEELPPPQMIDVENNGQSRLCCFRCGYDMCDKCADFLDNISEKLSKLKESKKLRVIADKVISRENGGPGLGPGGIHSKGSGGSFGKDKKSTASSSGGGAWVMDGVQLQTISKTVQQMQNNIRNSGNRANGTVHNGIAVQPMQH